MGVKEYSHKFTQLSKYAQTFVLKSRVRMNKFVMGVYDLFNKNVVRQFSIITWIFKVQGYMINKSRRQKKMNGEA